MKLEGTWKGKLIYGKGYFEHKNSELTFQMEILQEGNNLTGTAIDIEGMGKSNDAATIKGNIDGDKIYFSKRYDSLHYLDKSGNVVYDNSDRGPEIHYFGLFDNKDQSFTGTWQFSMKWKLLGFIPWKQNYHGTWNMKKNKADNKV